MIALKVLITKKGDKDEIAIYEYISEEFGEVYAKKFRKKLIDLFQIISTHPFIGRPAKNDSSIRVIIINRQNKIVYKVSIEEIVILRILNTKTNLSKFF